jgi:hypothetical protein
MRADDVLGWMLILSSCSGDSYNKDISNDVIKVTNGG